MSATIVEQYFNTWNERDADRRLALAENTWTPDARYVDPQADVTGPAAFSDLADSVHNLAPDHTFRLTSAVEQHHNQLRFAWEMVSPAGDVILSGIDLGQVADDGRLAAITGFFGAIPPTEGDDDGNVIEVTRDVAAPREVVWRLIIDHTLYGEIAPNLARVEVLSGEGKGMVRQCTNLNGQSWKETCTDWQDGHSYAFAIDIPTYPYPVQKMGATWAVEDHGDGSQIRMRFEIEPIDDDAGRQFMPLMKAAFPQVLDAILNRWQQDAEAAATT
jgi:uncharacterized protein YndB with AHSA1/START domain